MSTCSLSTDFDTLQLMVQIALVGHAFDGLVPVPLTDLSPCYDP